MKQIEENTMHSFRMAKSDIIQLQNDFIALSRSQSRMFEMLQRMGKHETMLLHKIAQLESRKPMIVRQVINKEVPKQITIKAPEVEKQSKKPVRKVYIAAKGSNKIHLKNCPFAQNIKPKNRLVFKSKIKPLNLGYKACKCVK